MATKGEAALLEAALSLFSDKGYEGTSMRDLARAAGMSTPNLYNYTTSKEDLLWRIMSDTMRLLLSTYRSRTEQLDCPVARTATFVRHHVEHHALHRRESIIGNGQIHFLTPERREAFKATRHEYEHALREMIEDGKRSGVFDVADPKLASFAIIQMGIAVSGWYRTDGPYTVSEVADHYVSYALKLLSVNEARHDLTCSHGTRCLAGHPAEPAALHS